MGRSITIALLACTAVVNALHLAPQRRARLSAIRGGRGGGAVQEGGASSRKRVQKFVDKNFFLVGMAGAVAVAGGAPGLGRDGSFLRPEVVVGKLGVGVVFFVSGLCLEFGALRAAAANWRLNLAIQVASLGAWPLLFAPAVGAARRLGLADARLLDGLLATACLPTTVNMCVVLTERAGGNVAAALSNAVIGNCLGVVATPALLYALLGRRAALPPVGAVASKLAVRVCLPVAAAQLLRRSAAVRAWQTAKAKLLKRTSEAALLAIVWNAFSTAFHVGLGVGAADLALLALGLPAIHALALLGLHAAFRTRSPPGDAVAAAYCASHKTLAFGLPLIKTLFAGNADLAYYCAPIMVLHPLQLLLGSLLAPRLARADD